MDIEELSREFIGNYIKNNVKKLGSDAYVSPNIPEKKLINAAKAGGSFKLLIIAIYDNTVFGAADRGLIFSETDVVWLNGSKWPCIPTISYDDITSIQYTKNYIKISTDGDNYKIDDLFTGSFSYSAFADLLEGIIGIIAQEVKREAREEAVRKAIIYAEKREAKREQEREAERIRAEKKEERKKEARQQREKEAHEAALREEKEKREQAKKDAQEKEKQALHSKANEKRENLLHSMTSEFEKNALSDKENTLKYDIYKEIDKHKMLQIKKINEKEKSYLNNNQFENFLKLYVQGR